MRELAEGESSAGNAIREVGGELSGDGEARDDSAIFQDFGFIRQALVLLDAARAITAIAGVFSPAIATRALTLG